ncbi:phosphofructokinase [Mycobacterium phage Museum]|uniref:DUF6378 domain-containing protein n=1 Tax=Mycobacterium phage Museum TaxID=2922214 RepID=G1D4S6_9CAUD|nr:phosphofructokinase [Mycobacterium phage Museum]AEK09774.1 hypothetical protein PBI_MUSEUM_54 [Mycobacterium phage Museum]
MTESILEEAQRLIHGPRNKNYGHPRENFADISALFSAYLERPISDLDVANLMILVKVARVKGTGYHRDSYTDIAGYAGCAERIYEEPVEEDDQPALFDLPLPDDLIRNENEDSLSWVDALNDITYADGEDEAALVDLDEPRVWNDIRHVPDGVDVIDRFGNRQCSRRVISRFRAEFVNEWAPFTEVVE